MRKNLKSFLTVSGVLLMIFFYSDIYSGFEKTVKYLGSSQKKSTENASLKTPNTIVQPPTVKDDNPKENSEKSGLENRIQVLETDMKNIQGVLGQVKTDVKSVGSEIKNLKEDTQNTNNNLAKILEFLEKNKQSTPKSEVNNETTVTDSESSTTTNDSSEKKIETDMTTTNDSSETDKKNNETLSPNYVGKKDTQVANKNTRNNNTFQEESYTPPKK